jgi:hypothetical protein
MVNIDEVKGSKAQAKQRIIDAMGKWLSGYKWDYFVTLTFDPLNPLKDTISAKKRFRQWINHELRKDGRVVQYALGVERFRMSDFLHLHALINGVGDMKFSDLGQAWRRRNVGYNTIKKYDPEKGASWYVAKYVTSGNCDWDFDFRGFPQAALIGGEMM